MLIWLVVIICANQASLLSQIVVALCSHQTCAVCNAHVLASLRASPEELATETATRASGLLKQFFQDASNLLGLKMSRRS